MFYHHAVWMFDVLCWRFLWSVHHFSEHPGNVNTWLFVSLKEYNETFSAYDYFSAFPINIDQVFVHLNCLWWYDDSFFCFIIISTVELSWSWLNISWQRSYHQDHKLRFDRLITPKHTTFNCILMLLWKQIGCYAMHWNFGVNAVQSKWLFLITL